MARAYEKVSAGGTLKIDNLQFTIKKMDLLWVLSRENSMYGLFQQGRYL
jgi:hypothetical protein